MLTLVTRIAVLFACIMAIAKFSVWLFSGSVSLLSSMVDSMLDVLASLTSLLAVQQALKPADEKYSFGYGKAEALAGLAQSAFITGSALFVLFEAAARVVNPRPIEYSGVAIIVMVVSMILTATLVIFQRKVAHKTGSLAVRADAAHYESDLLINITVIFSLLFSNVWNVPLLDTLLGAAIALYLLLNGWRIIQQSLDHLMDKEISSSDREKIIAIVREHPQVVGVHDLKTRLSGMKLFIQLHLEIPGDLTLTKAHIVADEVELALLRQFPKAEILIHQDPEGEGRCALS